ncbi:MAG: hypothetical protein ACP5SH_09315 [Syntrophobacteraceae bacterium]
MEASRVQVPALGVRNVDALPLVGHLLESLQAIIGQQAPMGIPS